MVTKSPGPFSDISSRLSARKRGSMTLRAVSRMKEATVSGSIIEAYLYRQSGRKRLARCRKAGVNSMSWWWARARPVSPRPGGSWRRGSRSWWSRRATGWAGARSPHIPCPASRSISAANGCTPPTAIPGPASPGNLGFALDEKLPDWGSRVAWRQGKAADADWRKARDEFYARLDRASEEPGDRAAAELLEPGNRWNPLLRAISTWANGAELDQVSVKDYGRYDPSDVNWRVLEGYGALIARHGEGLPVSLGTIVTRIDHGGHRVRIETRRGDLLARAVIVTLPTNVLASGAVGFIPALPGKLAAAAGLPMHMVNKFFLRLDGAIDAVAPDSNLVGDTGSEPHRRLSDQGRMAGR